MTVVHHSQLTPQVCWQDPASTREENGLLPCAIYCSPEVVPQTGLARVEHHVVPHILTAERSNHGKEEIENSEKFDKKNKENIPVREYLGVLMM